MDDFFPRCQHLTLAGARCTSQALRNKEFCYDHHYRRLRRARRNPILPDTRDVAGPLVTFVYMDDLDSVLENLNATAQAFAEHSIDHRQLGSLTYLMNTALKTVQLMSKMEKLRKEDMPTQVTHDDFDEPMAIPDAQPNPEPSIEPVIAAAPPLAAASPLAPTPNTCHPEQSEGPCVSDQASDHSSRHTDHVASLSPVSSLLSPDPETDRAASLSPVSSLLSPDSTTLVTLTAAADPTPEHRTPHSENPHNPSKSNHIEKSLFSTDFFSNTSTLRPCVTTPDSTLAQNRGVEGTAPETHQGCNAQDLVSTEP